MNAVHGSDVTLLCDIDGTENYFTVGCAESISFEFENELIGKTDVNAGLFRKKRVRISSFRGEVQGLLTLVNTTNGLSAFYFLQEGVRRSEQILRFLFTDEAGVSRVIDGTFLIQTVDITAQWNDWAESDIKFEGTGNLTIGDLPSPPAPTCDEAFSDWWQPSASATSFSGAGNEGKSFAGSTIIEVVRESGPPLNFTSGTPGEREYSFDGTTIGIWASNPFNGTERVFVIWQQMV